MHARLVTKVEAKTKNVMRNSGELNHKREILYKISFAVTPSVQIDMCSISEQIQIDHY